MNAKEAYDKGFVDGLHCFAWWRDGVEHVGIGSTMLKEAQKRLADLWNYDPPKED